MTRPIRDEPTAPIMLDAHRPGYSSSLTRGLAILNLVQEEGRVRVADIAARLRLPVSTVYRYVRQLVEARFLAEMDGYLIASDRLTDPSAGHGPMNLTRCGAPVLRMLRRATGQSAVLTVRVRSAALCLDVAAAPTRYYRFSLQQGKTSALYAGASVTPLLAYAPQSIIDEVLRGPLRKYTNATPDRQSLRAELQLIREEGYAISRGALDPGLTAIGMPVLADGNCICALSIVGPSAALAIPDGLVDALREGASALTSSISHEAVALWNAGDDE
jgi:DNA-binding IclR family transcriptional regulator